MKSNNNLQKKALRWRLAFVLLTVSLFPLALAGFGMWKIFGKLLEQKALEQMRILVQNHANAIETNLSNRIHLLQLLAQSHSISDLGNQENIYCFLADINKSSDSGFIDLGLLDTNGNHLAYAGPYKLLDINYSNTDWFKEVIAKEVYVSDVFLGFRQLPHCIVAVKGSREGDTWILRATINSKQFDELVKTGLSGKIIDAYVLNKKGFYQTVPNKGVLLDQSKIPPINYHNGVKDQRVTQNDTAKVIVTAWINNNRWILVVEQELKAILEPVDQAIRVIAKIVFIAVLFLIATTFIATWDLTNRIERANEKREEMSQAFIRSAKLASIGELSTGLAHEINNPLAIISAEQTNISDLISEIEHDILEKDQILHSVKRSNIQIERCANITRKMLQFGRKQKPKLEPMDIKPRISEIISFLERHINIRNIKITSELEEKLPKIVADQIEFEQVLVNLINNAVDALPLGGRIKIKAYSKNKRVNLEVIDNGIGIPPEVIDRIFEPFFTTKPVSKGTGLGLSVCYGLIHSWNGKIKAIGNLGKGTIIQIQLPLQSPDIFSNHINKRNS